MFTLRFFYKSIISPLLFLLRLACLMAIALSLEHHLQTRISIASILKMVVFYMGLSQHVSESRGCLFHVQKTISMVEDLMRAVC